jgi:hypothetical protein
MSIIKRKPYYLLYLVSIFGLLAAMFLPRFNNIPANIWIMFFTPLTIGAYLQEKQRWKYGKSNYKKKPGWILGILIMLVVLLMTTVVLLLTDAI